MFHIPRLLIAVAMLLLLVVALFLLLKFLSPEDRAHSMSAVSIVFSCCLIFLAKRALDVIEKSFTKKKH